jgi:hypothetical protein
MSISEIEDRLQHRVDSANEATVDLVAQECERIHNRILAVAIREFAAQGCKNTHVSKIMKELGITAAVFHGKVFAHPRVFELCTAAFAVVRVEGTQDDAELRKSIDEGPAGTVARIMKELPAPASPAVKNDTSRELLALSLFGAWEQTVFNASSRSKYSREDLFGAHLWLFLAAQAALKGEIDIDSRFVRYEPLIAELAKQLPSLPPILEEPGV